MISDVFLGHSKNNKQQNFMLLLSLNSKTQGNISTSNFDRQLPNILVTCLSSTYLVMNDCEAGLQGSLEMMLSIED